MSSITNSAPKSHHFSRRSVVRKPWPATLLGDLNVSHSESPQSRNTKLRPVKVGFFATMGRVVRVESGTTYVTELALTESQIATLSASVGVDSLNRPRGIDPRTN